MKKVCRASGQEFEVSQALQAFLKEYDFPIPDLCPQEQWRRQMAWKNERCLYKRHCDVTGKSIISVYSKDKPFPVYSMDYWWSDHWDPMEYGREIDFNRPFFEQFNELNQVVPKMALDAFENENCDFTNQTNWNKDCYLIFEADRNQHCYYGSHVSGLKDSMDCFSTYDGEQLYELVNCEYCHNVKFAFDSQRCRDSYFLRNCTNCKNCFGCVNLKHKQYYWLNEPLSQEAYEARLRKLNLASRSVLRQLAKDFAAHSLKFPRPFRSGYDNQDSTGDYLRHDKDCLNCFYTEESSGCENVFRGHQATHCFNATTPILGVENVYNSYAAGLQSSRIFCSWIAGKNSSSIYYSWWCIDNCQNLFGCVSLRQKQNCIFNKAYSKHEYEQLFVRLKAHMKETGEWGQFFPLERSPFAYNETVAQRWWPLSQEETLKRGLAWKELEDQALYQASTYAPPETINEASGDLTQKILACKTCQKNYRLIKPEVEFYQTHNLPIPEYCFECRQVAREAAVNPRQLFDRQCDRCKKPIQTSFAPDRPETVWCEDCYLNHALL